MLAQSTDRDRELNSSGLSVADSLGTALALSVSGVTFGVLGAFVAVRTRA